MSTKLAITLTMCLFAVPALATQSGPQEERFTALMGLARVKRDAGDAAAARRYFEEARQLRAFATTELTEYFWVLAGQDPRAALSVGLEVLAAAPSNAAVRDRLIAEAITLRDEATVEALARAGQHLEPGTARWPRRLGHSYLRQQRAADAVDAFTVAAQKVDATDEDRVHLAIALEAAHQYARALTAWNALPASVRTKHADWERSRLRSVAHAGDVPTAADDVSAWLMTHPDDRDMRALLVELWVRAGRPLDALAALEPLTTGPAAESWIRRRLAIARSAGLRRVAIESIDQLARSRRATADDRMALAELLLEDGQHDRADTILRGQMSAARPCDERLLTLIDRLPDPTGTDRLVEALTAPGCQPSSVWIRRGIDRAVAAARHEVALTLIERLPAMEAGHPDMLRLAGQLRLWTGATGVAVTVLEQALGVPPDDREARMALVHAYRAEHRPDEAWRAAAPLVDDAAIPETFRLLLTELALEAGRPADALALLDGVSARAAATTVQAALLGRALLANGRSAEALAVLRAIPTDAMTPPVALAFIDATAVMSGVKAAFDAAAAFPLETTDWRQVLARRLTLASASGQADRAARLRAALASIDPELSAITDVEIALEAGRPHEALAIVARLPDDPQAERVADLEALARAAIGDTAGALAIVTRLRAARPHSPSLLIRETELRHRVTATEDTLRQVTGLPERLPGHEEAMLAAARALAAGGRHREALDVLGPEPAWTTLPAAGRIVAARCLQATGRAAEALALLDDSLASEVAAAALRAELIAATLGPSRARDAFADAARHGAVSPQLFVKWAEVAATADERARILADGATRFPDDVPLLIRLAAAELAAGHADAAAVAATRALDRDPGATSAWLTRVDAARQRGESIDRVLLKFEAAAAGNPALAIDMAAHLSAMVRPTDDPLVRRIAGWLNALAVPDDALAVARDEALARIYSAAERWPEAIKAVDAALVRRPDQPTSLRLRAELLSWAGRHREALEAYDVYLAQHPQDLEARRQQARVAGWSGAVTLSRRLYASLVADAPQHAAAAAEAEAKSAYFDGRWSAAVDAYARWIALEPSSGEARFEAAESLRAAGQVADADAALAALATTSDHRLALARLDRAARERQPRATAMVDLRAANGYGRQRLLDLRQQGASLDVTLDPATETALSVAVAHVRADGSGAVREGYRGTLSASAQLGPGFTLAGHAGLWPVASAGSALPEAGATVSWRPADRWTILAAGDRSPLLENTGTIDSRLSAAGLTTGLQFESPQTTFDLRISSHLLSDRNRRQRATVSATRAIGDRLRQLRLVGWAESLGYRRRTATYFSPASHVRVDGGLEYTHAFRRPRFRGDRTQTLAVGYLIGTDNNGTAYHHPLIRLSLEFANGLTIDGRASWIRSTVYRETSAFLGVSLPAGGRSR